jgi:hypothetical protein
MLLVAQTGFLAPPSVPLADRGESTCIRSRNHFQLVGAAQQRADVHCSHVRLLRRELGVVCEEVDDHLQPTGDHQQHSRGIANCSMTLGKTHEAYLHRRRRPAAGFRRRAAGFR